MKPRTEIILIGTLLIGVAALSSMKREARSDSAGQGRRACCPFLAVQDAKPVPASTNQITTSVTAQQVIAYYFHGTIRCETCLKIEKQAKEVIEQQFSAELATNRLMFTSVNYDLPENAHFLQDYKLPCPSLVLVRQKDGKDGQWKLLRDTWQLVEDPVKFNLYVETEVRKFLGGQEQQASTNKIESSPPPDHR